MDSSESCSVLSNSLRPHGLYSPWNSPGQNTGVGSLSLFQGLFPTQGLNPGLPHCSRIFYQLSHKGSPNKSTSCIVLFSCSVVSDSATLWTAACQASLSFIVSWSLLRLMSSELVMPSNHLVLCHTLLFLPSTFPNRS